VCTFQGLNAVEKGVVNISHILSRNMIEGGDLEEMKSISVSWIRDNSSVGN